MYKAITNVAIGDTITFQLQGRPNRPWKPGRNASPVLTAKVRQILADIVYTEEIVDGTDNATYGVRAKEIISLNGKPYQP